MQLSLRALEDLQGKYEGMKKRVQNTKAAMEETVMTVVQSAEVSGAAFSLGVINGYWSRPEFLGVPVDALSALLLHGAGFAFDDGSRHFHNLGDGALATYLSSVGTGIGIKMLQERQAAVRPATP